MNLLLIGKYDGGGWRTEPCVQRAFEQLGHKVFPVSITEAGADVGRIRPVDLTIVMQGYGISAPMVEFNMLVSMRNMQPFLFSRRFSPILPARLEAVLFPPQQLPIIFAILWGIVLTSILTKAWMQNKAWWVVIAMTILVFPHYFIIWHGDVMGIYRHVLSVSIQFYIGSWLLALYLADRVLSFRGIQETPFNRLFVRSMKQ